MNKKKYVGIDFFFNLIEIEGFFVIIVVIYSVVASLVERNCIIGYRVLFIGFSIYLGNREWAKKDVVYTLNIPEGSLLSGNVFTIYHTKILYII